MAKVVTIKSSKPRAEKSADVTEPKVESSVSVEIEESKDSSPRTPKSNRVCVYCHSKTEPTYTDTQTLKKFLSDRSRIQPKNRTHLCSKHQRRATVAIKHARHLSMLPFIAAL